MLYLTCSGDVSIIILETGNLEELKNGGLVTTPDKKIAIAWTPDPVWLADRLLDSKGDVTKIAAAVDESTKRPQKPFNRPNHPTHVHDFRKERQSE